MADLERDFQQMGFEREVSDAFIYHIYCVTMPQIK